MRRSRAALVLALALLTGCGQGGGTQTPAAFALPQPDRLVEVTLPESCETLDQLADAIDTAIFLSPTDAQGETVWFSLGEVLREEALADPDAFVGRVLQITALGHDLAQTYNTSRLEEGLLGVQGGFQPAYALRTPQEEPYDRAISYTLCRNAMERAAGLTWEELPLCRDNRGWVRVVNSEQLFYALSHGYLPWCTPDDPAFPLLERCVAILSSIIPQGAGEREIYTAIYQYVTSRVAYSYTTLAEGGRDRRENRAMFLEGALTDELAVCDGLSKEIVVLSRLMGLDARHIGARDSQGGHAYVYVQVEGNWYLSCPTRGSGRSPTSAGGWRNYPLNSYLLTDFDTNMPGWEYDSDAWEDIEAEIRTVKPFDFWGDTTVEIDRQTYSLHPETQEEAMAVLEDGLHLSRERGEPVAVELMGSVDVLRGAYQTLKDRGEDVAYLSAGTFAGKRLQVYVLGGGA